MNTTYPRYVSGPKTLIDLLNSPQAGIAQITTGHVIWQFEIVNGQLLYATHSLQSYKAVEFYLKHLGYNAAISPSKALWSQQEHQVTRRNGMVAPTWSVDFVEQLDAQGILSWNQANALMEQLSKDSMETALWAPEARITWLDITEGAKQQRFVTWQGTNFKELMQTLLKRLQVWQTLAPDIQSPHQYPYCIDSNRLHETAVTGGILPTSTLELLRKLMKGASLRQIAQILKQDELKLAQLLYPYVKQGVLAFRQPEFPFNRLPLIPATLPVSSEAPPASPTTSGVKKQGYYKIICIDDNTSMLETMEQYLSNDCFEVTTVKNPMESVSAMFAAHPDLVLMDVSMPGINGHRLCQILKRSSAFKTVPIIMVSSNAGALDRAKARAMGATDYLAKPFPRDELLRVINQYLRFSDDFIK